MITIKEVVIVEGRYDKVKLSSIIDGLIIETGGFQIFSDKERLNLIKRLADTRGILILTDSDSAGFMIRNYLCGSIPKDKIKHAYIPDIFGKERRKDKPSKEGKLGVEGVPRAVIEQALARAGVAFDASEGEAAQRREITKFDFYVAGLSGGEGSAERRKELLKYFDLPERMTANALLQALNCLVGYEEFLEIMGKIASEKTSQK